MAFFKRVPFHKKLKAAIEAAEKHGYRVVSVEQDHPGYPVVMDKKGKRIYVTGPKLKRRTSKKEMLAIAKHIKKVHTPILEDTPGAGFFMICLEKRGRKKKEGAWIMVKGTPGFRLFNKVYGHEPRIGFFGIDASDFTQGRKIRKTYKEKLKRL
jgi:hypothetical protein